MRTSFVLTLAVAAMLSAPALAQSEGSAGTGTSPVQHQPNGAVVPNPSSVGTPNVQGDATAPVDPVTTGTIRSRDTVGMRQSPEERNALGCRQIDPLCQGGR